MTLRIMTIYGTRPEAIKVAPIIKAIEADADLENVHRRDRPAPGDAGSGQRHVRDRPRPRPEHHGRRADPERHRREGDHRSRCDS